ncbi:glycosyltransferase [Sphingomonas sp. ASV193]|uniref:glycosyltransferase n=1 Tax=Sphingomonas sp. ASV193 TaxID=3144405 RepID=UPI0032E8A93F
MIVADVTQSWSAVGGGVGTYLRAKRRYLLERTEATHVMVLPGPRTETLVEAGGRAISCFVKSPPVPFSPNYRLMLDNRAVRAALAAHRPDVIECQDAYNLPWAALRHARRNPGTAVVGAYMTDFPTAYVSRPIGKVAGAAVGGALARLAYAYVGQLYRRFDLAYALSRHGGADKLERAGVTGVEVVPLGADIDAFSPDLRDEGFRAALGVAPGQALLVYAGRMDAEKRAQTVVDAFLALPEELGAHLLLLGDGPLREKFVAQGAGRRLHALGFVGERARLATALASADLYVSGMADETFGLSIVEAQASGLGIVGVAAGAMIDRVPAALGRLGPVGDGAAMADNIRAMLGTDLVALRGAARAHAERYSWTATMDRLVGELYPLARARAAASAGRAPVRGGAPLAEA